MLVTQTLVGGGAERMVARLSTYLKRMAMKLSLFYLIGMIMNIQLIAIKLKLLQKTQKNIKIVVS